MTSVSNCNKFFSHTFTWSVIENKTFFIYFYYFYFSSERPLFYLGEKNEADCFLLKIVFPKSDFLYDPNKMHESIAVSLSLFCCWIGCLDGYYKKRFVYLLIALISSVFSISTIYSHHPSATSEGELMTGYDYDVDDHYSSLYKERRVYK